MVTEFYKLSPPNLSGYLSSASKYSSVPENYERPLIANQIRSETDRADISFNASWYHSGRYYQTKRA